jgi:hypothetical protein
MTRVCAPDNFACLIQNLPATADTVGLIFVGGCIAAAVFATLTYRSF